MTRHATLSARTAPNERSSVLAAELSPRNLTPAASRADTRLISSRSGARGSAASTTSPALGGSLATRRRSPGSRVGAMDRPRTWTTSRRSRAATSARRPRMGQIRPTRRIGLRRAPVDAGLLCAAGRLPHLVDRVDHREQLLRRAEVERLLHLRGLLRRLPERLVQVGVR